MAELKKNRNTADCAAGQGEALPLVPVSVRRMVEFLLRSGDLDRRVQRPGDQEAALAGGRLHRKLQKAAGPGYAAEVALSCERTFPDLVLRVEGRADGIITPADGGIPVIDEIKGMYLDVRKLGEPFPLHVAQARCYAAIYAAREQLPEVGVRITYGNLETEEIRRFDAVLPAEELAEWFDGLVTEYHRWASVQVRHIRLRNESIRELAFPFPYREGQRKLAAVVYHTVKEGGELFLMAPTGVGKTMSCLFPAVKGMGEGFGSRLFYLTARNETLRAGREALAILWDRGLVFRTVQVTSKEKICPLSEPVCNPDGCPYARGHYDRINAVLFAMLGEEDGSDGRESVLRQSARHNVCPYELQMDLAAFSDAVLCDYNYVFDPDAQLQRLLSGGKKGDHLFLVDEAHNLVDRGREIFSAVLEKDEVMRARRLAKDRSRGVEKAASSVNRAMLALRKQTEEAPGGKPPGAVRRTFSAEECGELLKAVRILYMAMQELYQGGDKSLGIPRGGEGTDAPGRAAGNHREPDVVPGQVPASWTDPSGKQSDQDGKQSDQDGKKSDQDGKQSDQDGNQLEASGNPGEELLDFYFQVRSFVAVAEDLDEDYVLYGELREKKFFVKLFCVNPARKLSAATYSGRASIFFSATLLPPAYFRKMLTVHEKAPFVYAPSPFDGQRRLVLTAEDVSARFTVRGESMYRKLAAYISCMVAGMTGNYLVFFPSYRLMEDVFAIYRREYDRPGVNWVVQRPGMQEMDREIFLEDFYERPAQSLVGFCVLGGGFSEGLDLAGTRLIGAAVVGTGIPQVNNEREILKEYYAEREDGFDYAYRYPGMNRVLQAAGRVIRTAEDTGVVLLLDDRFRMAAYRKLFPREWTRTEACTLETVGGKLRAFWEEAATFP